MITITFNDAFDCFTNVLVDTIKYYNCSYEMLFLKSWNFGYSKIENSGDSISKNMRTNCYHDWNLLEEVHGIQVKAMNADNKKEVYSYIKSSVKQGKPVILSMDVFWCSWYKSVYQKMHSNHCCVITEVDCDGNLIAQDAQFAIQGEILSYEDFEAGVEKYVVVNVVHEEKFASFDWKSALKDAMQRIKDNKYNGRDMFGQLTDLSDDIRLKLDFDKEVDESKSPQYSNLFQMFGHISSQRKQLALALDYLYKNTNRNDILLSIKRIIEVGERWNSLFGLLCKAYYCQGSRRMRIINKVSDYILWIRDEESAIYHELFDIAQGKPDIDVRTSKKFLEEKRLTEYQCIDLSKYYNNKGFAEKMILDSKASFSDGHRFFLVDDNIKNNEWKVQNMKFAFPHVAEDLCDNISCNQEVIKIDGLIASNLLFLGAGELGNHMDVVEVHYEDTTVEKVNLVFPSWLTRMDSKASIAWEGNAAEQYSDDSISKYPFPVFLYAENIKLEHGGKIKNLVLPFCPNLHLFCLTLAN